MGRLLIEYHTIDCKHPEMKLANIDTKNGDFEQRLARMQEKEY